MLNPTELVLIITNVILLTTNIIMGAVMPDKPTWVRAVHGVLAAASVVIIISIFVAAGQHPVLGR